MSNIQTVREAAKACMARAEEMFGVDMSDVQIRFDLKGCSAGMAGYAARFGRFQYYLRFNVTMIEHNGFDHVLNDTVPHEIAHMVCFKNPKLGNAHNRGWARVCQALGGTGQRCHKEEVVYAKGRTYEYTCTKGTKQRFSEQRHKKIQRGVTYSLRRGGQINKGCEYEVVGVSGRPIQTKTKPKVTDMNTPTVEPTPAVAAETTPVEAATKPTPAPKAAKAPTKADQVRAAIQRAKAAGFAEEGDARQAAVDFAKAELGMKPAMARRYVQENWAKA